MHIPDGYLGPITYIALFIIMVPIWLYAGYRVRKDLRSKQVPLLALSAAFTFVIMMFNVPIPGGSTGHAVGGAIIGIILGPWAAIVSISVALIIQAFVFGDGGITAIGANCFNMGVVMPIVGYYTYKLISGNSDIKSVRRIAAAVIAGYLSLVIASGFAGFEFGIQPYLYPAVNGQFPYMPYDLSVTLPAMLGEHILFFGVLEALITGLVFVYFQRNTPELLENKKSKKAMLDKVPV
ncbi:putative truncated cobalamin biosynthesis protein [Methanocella paludicola SANAE]|uniref:Truncated cobalamin biosynthesis protein n=1 Tax=Methanocella paludicola (strain DSM 17711 / JCM 13418 / NBRC 101707 / SANAE) TaxID=304371 RepID=D1YXI5_METPS|nr:cobalt transporter CbiM [Methanocella paludicola]BAI61157.1 putative truncated cobalamin biosynthesis protein [Methanocella paludicola SANAE]